MSEDETKAVVAALNFIIVNSTKYDTESEVVSNELQQLGLPRGILLIDIINGYIYSLIFSILEHSVALCKVYSDNLSNLKAALKEQSLKCNSISFHLFNYVSNLSCLVYSLKSSSYEVESFFSNDSFTVECPSVVLNLKGNQPNPTSTSFYVPPEKLDNLIHGILSQYDISVF